MTPEIRDDNFFVKTKFCFHIHNINSNVWVEFFQYIVYRYMPFDKIFKSYKNVKYTSELESNKSMNINILHKSLNRFFTPNFLLSRSCKRIFLYFHFPLFSFFDSLYGCISLHTIYRNMNGMKKYFHSGSLQLSAIH